MKNVRTSSGGIGKAGQDGDEDGTDDVENRPDQVHLDRSMHVRILPAKVGQTADGQSDGEPSGESDISEQQSDVFDEQIE